MCPLLFAPHFGAPFATVQNAGTLAPERPARPKAAQGGVCASDPIDATGAHACSSANCVDGFCCNTACAGACAACARNWSSTGIKRRLTASTRSDARADLRQAARPYVPDAEDATDSYKHAAKYQPRSFGAPHQGQVTSWADTVENRAEESLVRLLLLAAIKEGTVALVSPHSG